MHTRVRLLTLAPSFPRPSPPPPSSRPIPIKAPMSWYLKELVIVAVYIPLFTCMLGYDAVFRGGVLLPGWARAGAAFLAGSLLQSFSFCTLHDASHYGLFFKV